MGQIVLNSVTFSYTPYTNQEVSVYYKLTTESSYTLWTDTAIILPNGNFSPAVTITGLEDGTDYDIMVESNCGGSSEETTITSTGTAPTTSSSTTTTTSPLGPAMFSVDSWEGPFGFQAGSQGPVYVNVESDRAYDQDVTLTFRMERFTGDLDYRIHIDTVTIPAGQTTAQYVGVVYREGVYATCVITGVSPQYVTSGGTMYYTTF